MKHLLIAVTTASLLFLLGHVASATTMDLIGFEVGDSTDCAASSGTFSIQTSTVRTGTYALRANPTTTGTGYCQLNSFTSAGANAATNKATLYTRFYFRYATKPSSNNEPIFAALESGNTVKQELRLNSAGNLALYDSNIASIATGTTALSANTWYRIELVSNTGTSTTYEVRINGSTELSGSGANFQALNNARLRYGKTLNRNGNSVEFFYDDIIANDTGFPGAGEIKILYPNADGTYQTFATSTAGSHYQMVDEIPPNDDTDYLLSPTGAGNAETENVIDTATAGITGTINSVRGYLSLKRNGASNGSINQRLRSGTTDTDSGAIAVGSTYITQKIVYDTDPNTSSAWTTSGLDAAEIGARENSAANASRMSAAYIIVDYTPSAAPSVASTTPSFIRKGWGVFKGFLQIK